MSAPFHEEDSSGTSSRDIVVKIVSCILSLPTQYGKVTLAGILSGNYKSVQQKQFLLTNQYFGCLNPYTEENIVSLITQLIEQGYLQVINVGFEFPIEVLQITDRGKSFVSAPHDVALQIPPVYTADFKEATTLADAGITEEMVREYYRVKRQLDELEVKEKNLKDHLKYCMMHHKISRVATNNVELFLREVERILYPKAEVEREVPKDILEKIKKVQKSLVMTIKKINHA